jgi:membrane protein DedA with SNARE-associated domain
MSYARFIFLDSLGVLVSVPTSIWVSYLFFRKIGFEPESVAKNVSRYNHYILAGVAIAIVAWIVWRRLRRRERDAASASGSP